MSSQPSFQPDQNVHEIGNPSIPQFEGLPVTAVAIKITGLHTITEGTLPVFSIDDRVRLIGEFRCIGVRHRTEKDGTVIREQVLVPDRVDTCPWDPEDLSDDGVIRSR